MPIVELADPPIVEVVLVTSSPNKKAPTLLFSYCCTSDTRRRSVRFSIPPHCFHCPACRPAPVDWTFSPCPFSTTAAGGDNRRRGWRRRPTAHVLTTANSLGGSAYVGFSLTSIHPAVYNKSLEYTREKLPKVRSLEQLPRRNIHQ